MTTSYSEVKKIIEQKGLTFSTRRRLPFLTYNCVGYGYVFGLKKQFGISYEVIGNFGIAGSAYSMYNDNLISHQISKLIDKFGKNIFRETIDRADILVKKVEKNRMVAAQKLSRDPFLAIRILLEVYPDYMAAIGLYNAFMRYVGYRESVGILSAKDVQTLAKRRDAIARVYPKCEKLLESACLAVGKEIKVNGDLLRYATQKEILVILSNRAATKKVLEKLKARKSGYIYFFSKKFGEKIITNKKIIKKFKKDFWQVKNVPEKISGQVVQVGRAKGLVYNLESGKSAPKLSGYILIASQTHPDLLPIIKKAAAIVADEGGILSHAAVVSRELKIPCIIGTKIGSRVFKDGDRVEVDATKGIVKKIK